MGIIAKHSVYNSIYYSGLSLVAALLVCGVAINSMAFAYPGYKCTAEIACSDAESITASLESDSGPSCYEELVSKLKSLCSGHGGLNVGTDWWSLFQAQQKKEEMESAGKEIFLSPPLDDSPTISNPLAKNSH